MRRNKERSIERYINGRMGPAEQREFLKQAEHDPSIKRMLKAEQVIGSAVARDRAALPLIAVEPGAGLLTKLAATKPAGVGSAAGAGSSAAGSGTAGVSAGSAAAGSSAGIGAAGSVAGTGVVGGAAGSAAGSSGILSSILFGSKIAQAIVAVVGVSGIAVGTFMVAPIIQRSASETSTPAPVERKMELRSAPTAPQVTNEAAIEAAPAPELSKAAEEATPQQEAASSTPRSARASATPRKNQPQPAQAEPMAKKPASAAVPKKADPEPVEIEDPQVKITIENGKGNK